jgi:hypothetical protein
VAGDKYDISISYARRNLQWVEEHLLAPLHKCRLKNGRTPRIFFDLGEEGIGIGENFLAKIAAAMSNSDCIIPVYTPEYFVSGWCKYELNLAVRLHVEKGKKVLPILQDPNVTELIPLEARGINARSVEDPSWFERLCAALGVSPAAIQPQLEFPAAPPPATARLTLPPVKVIITVGGQLRTTADDEITISADGAELQGTLKQKASSGTATFTDLIIPTAAPDVRLVAVAPGIDPVRSAPFDVQAPPPPPVPPDPPTIAVEGESEVVFFASGRAVLLFRPGSAAVYSLSGQPLGQEVSLVGRVRLVSRAGNLIAVADWSGNVWLFSDTGQHKTWAFGGGKGGFVVPGGIAFDGPNVFVGFWSGLVFRVSLEGGAGEVLRHEAGVQTLTVYNGRCYVADFGGALAVYNLTTQQLVNTGVLEKAVWLLRPTTDGLLLAVGDEHVYQISTSPFQIHHDVLPAGATGSVFADSARPVLVADDGAGLRLNPQLVFRRFRVAPGTVPVGADDRGTFCVCVAPDGRRTLVSENKVVRSYPSGTLAVSPNGDLFALGERGGVRLTTPSGLGLGQGGGA